MATIDIKLKSYDELQIETMNLITKNYFLQQKIDKANQILSKILVIKRYDGNYGPVKNTTKEEVYKTICMLNEILETPQRVNHHLLGDGNNE